MLDAIVFGILILALLWMGRVWDKYIGMLGAFMLTIYPWVFTETLGLAMLPSILVSLTGVVFMFILLNDDKGW